MKHLKHFPLNDKAQTLSKDMKKQDLIKAKKAKKIDADKSLSDPKISMRTSKPSNKKLDGEKFLSEAKAWLKPDLENSLSELIERDDEIGELARIVDSLRDEMRNNTDYSSH